MARSLTKSSFRRNNASQAEDVLRFPLEENSFFKKVVIMKKTLAAVAVLGAFAGSALAADVTLYGKVDFGFVYDNVQNKGGVDGADNNSVGLESGVSSGSRFGLKGSEQISEGLTVGFQLEQGFNADDGTFSSDRMFHREARAYVATDYGTFHFGRFGALDSGTGSLDVVGGFSASGTGYAGTLDQSTVLRTYSRMDNSIAYTSPEFAGLQLSAMVSLKTAALDSDGNEIDTEESNHESDRYYGVGLTGQWGNLGAGLVVSQSDVSVLKTKDKVDADQAYSDDVLNITAGVNYDFGVAKTFLAANYYDAGEIFSVAGTTAVSKAKAGVSDLTGWGVVASVEAPVAAGTLEAMVGYGVDSYDMEVGEDIDEATWTVGAFYKYPLSKRTYMYAGAGYTTTDYDVKDAEDENVTTVYTGICHNF